MKARSSSENMVFIFKKREDWTKDVVNAQEEVMVEKLNRVNKVVLKEGGTTLTTRDLYTLLQPLQKKKLSLREIKDIVNGFKFLIKRGVMRKNDKGWTITINKNSNPLVFTTFKRHLEWDEEGMKDVYGKQWENIKNALDGGKEVEVSAQQFVKHYAHLCRKYKQVFPHFTPSFHIFAKTLAEKKRMHREEFLGYNWKTGISMLSGDINAGVNVGKQFKEYGTPYATLGVGIGTTYPERRIRPRLIVGEGPNLLSVDNEGNLAITEKVTNSVKVLASKKGAMVGVNSGAVQMGVKTTKKFSLKRALTATIVWPLLVLKNVMDGIRKGVKRASYHTKTSKKASSFFKTLFSPIRIVKNVIKNVVKEPLGAVKNLFFGIFKRKVKEKSVREEAVKHLKQNKAILKEQLTQLNKREKEIKSYETEWLNAVKQQLLHGPDVKELTPQEFRILYQLYYSLIPPSTKVPTLKALANNLKSKNYRQQFQHSWRHYFTTLNKYWAVLKKGNVDEAVKNAVDNLMKQLANVKQPEDLENIKLEELEKLLREKNLWSNKQFQWLYNALWQLKHHYVVVLWLSTGQSTWLPGFVELVDKLEKNDVLTNDLQHAKDDKKYKHIHKEVERWNYFHEKIAHIEHAKRQLQREKDEIFELLHRRTDPPFLTNTAYDIQRYLDIKRAMDARKKAFYNEAEYYLKRASALSTTPEEKAEIDVLLDGVILESAMNTLLGRKKTAFKTIENRVSKALEELNTGDQEQKRWAYKYLSLKLSRGVSFEKGGYYLLTTYIPDDKLVKCLNALDNANVQMPKRSLYSSFQRLDKEGREWWLKRHEEVFGEQGVRYLNALNDKEKQRVYHILSLLPEAAELTHTNIDEKKFKDVAGNVAVIFWGKNQPKKAIKSLNIFSLKNQEQAMINAVHDLIETRLSGNNNNLAHLYAYLLTLWNKTENKEEKQNSIANTLLKTQWGKEPFEETNKNS